MLASQKRDRHAEKHSVRKEQQTKAELLTFFTGKFHTHIALSGYTRKDRAKFELLALIMCSAVISNQAVI